MNIKEIFEQVERIRQERFLEAHHDSYDLNQPDLNALDCVMNLLKILEESTLEDSVTVEELLAASNITK